MIYIVLISIGIVAIILGLGMGKRDKGTSIKSQKLEFMDMTFDNYEDYLAAKRKNYSVEIMVDDNQVSDADHHVTLNTTNSESNIPFFLVFDIETTGLKPYSEDYEDLDLWPNIVQIAWIIADNRCHIIKERSSIIKQFKPIPTEATNIHKITDEIAESKGQDITEVLMELLKDIKQVKYLVSHNIDFDLPILKAELLRNDMKLPVKKKICTMKKGKRITDIELGYSSKLKFPKLSELFGRLVYNHTDITIINSHDAMIDTRITLFCLSQLISIGEIEIEDTQEI